MKLTKSHIRNFRRLEDVEINFEKNETVFVGPNNSGKTSATTAFRLFLTAAAFKIHDISVSKIKDIDRFGAELDTDESILPSIEMDIWFSIEPDIEFGRVFSLLPSLSDDLAEVGIRMKFGVRDAEKMKAEYTSAFPFVKENENRKSLSHFLSMEGMLTRHFALSYFGLEKTEGEELAESSIEPEEGKRILSNLIRVDFVDAQRNIDDREVSTRSNRLSAAFGAFYKNNLKQASVKDEASKVLDENNENLNKHYDEHFGELMDVIQGLGVPSVNDRSMRVVSTLSPEVALQGNTDLLYLDADLNHELPEAYNGLGFKNLIYMAIQISHFHIQWMNTEIKRPLCQIIFIEEPEAHLHAQVQQTFISNIWGIIEKASNQAGEETMIPQFVVTTHSSHILDAVDFIKIRYFRRCLMSGDVPEETTKFNASHVLNLRDFRPQKLSAGGDAEDENRTMDFLKKYLRLTHCDLFFADATILVEGAVEKLLLPTMIGKCAPQLERTYLTILEVGGAFAYRFASLMEFLGTPYLVVTDLDSVDPNENRKTCRADTIGAVTSNASIDFFLKEKSIAELIKLNTEQHILGDSTCFIAFQKSSEVKGYDLPMIGRTFEETFVYENIELFRDRHISLGKDLPAERDFENEYKKVFEVVTSKSFKKTEFALKVASSDSKWTVPNYVEEGLKWLERKISPVDEIEVVNAGDKK